MAVFSVVDLLAVLAAANVVYVSIQIPMSPPFLPPITSADILCTVDWPRDLSTLLAPSRQVPRTSTVEVDTMA